MVEVIDDLTRFRELPEIIESEKNKLRALFNKNNEIKTKITLKENKVRIDIQNETVDSKPIFSNQEKRDAELIRRLSVNDEYKILKDEVLSEEQKLKEQEAHVERLLQEFTRIKVTLLYESSLNELTKIKN